MAFIIQVATATTYSRPGAAMSKSDLYSTGLHVRREVLGHEYVDGGLAASDDFMLAFQEAVTELAWGYSWSRPGLDRRTRLILTLGILAGLGRYEELGIYAQGAVRNGVTVDEIKEILIHVASSAEHRPGVSRSSPSMHLFSRTGTSANSPSN
jgi:4-carboxymuconolactone decarboxylase